MSAALRMMILVGMTAFAVSTCGVSGTTTHATESNAHAAYVVLTATDELTVSADIDAITLDLDGTSAGFLPGIQFVAFSAASDTEFGIRVIFRDDVTTEERRVFLARALSNGGDRVIWVARGEQWPYCYPGATCRPAD